MRDKARQILCITLFVAVSALSNVFPFERWLNSSRLALAHRAGLPLTLRPVLVPSPPSETEALVDFTLGHINTLPLADLEVTYAALESQAVSPRVANFKLMLGDILSHKRKVRDPLGTHPYAEDEAPTPEDPDGPPPPDPGGE